MLLTERFQLKTHFETRDIPVYALVVAKDGAKMKEVVPDPPPAPGTPSSGRASPAVSSHGSESIHSDRMAHRRDDRTALAHSYLKVGNCNCRQENGT